MRERNNLSLRGMFSNYAGLPASIYILFVARIINRFGGFVHAFLTFFLSIYLGMSDQEIGLYVLTAGAAGFAGSLSGGWLGDRYSRKIVYLTAQAMAAVLFVPCAWFAYTGDYGLIPGFMIASSFFGSVVRPVNTAMVADIVDREDRRRAFSLLYLGINIGVAVGPIVGALLLNDFLVWFFLGDAITTFVAVILVAFFVQERRITDEEMDALDENDSESKEHGNVMEAFLKRPVLIVFVLFTLINSMMYAQVGFAFPRQMENLFGQINGPTSYAQLTMFNALVVIFCTSATHYLTQNVKPIHNIMTASLFYSVGLGMMAFVGNMPMLYLSTFIWTIGEIQAATNHNVYLMHHTPINYRSRFMAIISTITSLGHVFSPALGGVVLENFGQTTLWLGVFWAGIIAALGFYAIGRYEKNKEKEVIAA